MDNPETVQGQQMKDHAISWEVDIPLVTNPNMVGAWFKAMSATYLLCMVILGAIFIGTGEFESLPMIAAIFALVTLGIALAGLLIMLVLFGNRFSARFTVSDKGILYEGIDQRARTLARMAVVAGAFGGSARTSGAGLLAISQEQVALNWHGAFSARYQPRRHTIILRNQWRDLLHLYCTAENYTAVQALVEKRMMQRGTRERLQTQPSPLPGALLATTLVVIASLPIYALNEITKLDLLLPILIMVFSLATIWLIPLFGWVVLPLEVYVLFHLTMALTEFRQFTLVSTYSYYKYEALDAGEWTLITLSLAGMGYLGWTAWRAVRGRLIPVLMQDGEGMSG